MTEASNSRTLRRWFTVGAVVVLVVAIWLILAPLIMPIAWAAILAFLMHPLQMKLTQRFPGRHSLVASILTTITPIVIFVPLALISMAFAQQIGSLTTTLQQHSALLLDMNTLLDPARNPRLAGIAAWFTARLDMSPAEIQTYLQQGVQSWATAVAKLSGRAVLMTVSALLQFFLMLFILFFMLRDGALWFARIAALLPLSSAGSDVLFMRVGKVLRAVVYGCGLTALLQGTLVSIGFAIAGLSGPIVFGVLASLLALLPFGGAALVWVPGMLYLLGSGSVGWAMFLLAWGVVVSVSDNFVRPVIISRYTPVPTLLVFLGVVGGVAAFGAIGFIIGPVILVLATELLRHAEGSITPGD